MDIVSTIILGLLGITLTVTVLGVATAIYRSSSSSESFHEALATKLENLRLGKMLDYLGIERRQYIFTQPAHEIDKNIRQCVACEAKHECDDLFQQQNKASQSIEFCPNKASLKGIK